MGRYEVISTADNVAGLGSFDDPDEAIINCMSVNYEVLDTETGEYLTPGCQGDVDDAFEKWSEKQRRAQADPEPGERKG